MANESIKNAFARMWQHVTTKLGDHTTNNNVHITAEEKEKLNGLTTETWTFTLEDGSTVTKRVVIG